MLRLTTAVDRMIVILAISVVFATEIWLAYLVAIPLPEPLASQPGGTVATAILILLLGASPAWAACISIQDPKWAGRISIWTAVVLVCWLSAMGIIQHRQLPHEFFASEYFGATRDSLGAGADGLVSAGLLVVSGVLWSLRRARSQTQSKSGVRLVTMPIIGAVIVVLAGVCAAAIAADLRRIDSFDCHFIPQPLAAQRNPDEAAFTAQLLRVRRVWPSKQWGFALVRREYWGLPWWARQVVVVALEGEVSPLAGGEMYFVAARRRRGSVTRFLPLYDTSCSRTRLLKDAEIDLRVIHDGVPKNGARVLGHTVRSANSHEIPVPSIKVVLQGPTGEFATTISDQAGIYDLPDVPTGDSYLGYEANGKIIWQLSSCATSMKSGDVRDCALAVK
jgi:hypothetical protein